MEHNSLFEKTPPLKLFFTAAIPGGISMLASSLYGILDGIFVGRILGETAFAAVNLVFPLIFINFSLADLIGVGSSVPISIALGKKEEKEADNLFTCACMMIVLTGTLMGVLFYLGAPALVRLMGAEGELAALGVRYMRVYALTSPVTTIVFAMDNYLRICGRLRSSMNLNIFMSVISIVLEFTFLRIFRWGISGAALASCSGMFICAILAFAPFLRGKLLLKLRRPHFSASMIRRVIACGCPVFLSNIAGRVTAIVLNMVLLNFGGEMAISVYGVLMYTGETLQSLLYGVCDALQPAVGYNWGAGRRDRVRDIERCCFTASAVISIGSMTLMYFLPAEPDGVVCWQRGPGVHGNGGSRHAAVQFHLPDPLVLLCGAELYDGCEPPGSRRGAVRIDRVWTAAFADCTVLASEADRRLAELSGDLSVGRNPRRDDPAAVSQTVRSIIFPNAGSIVRGVLCGCANATGGVWTCNRFCDKIEPSKRRRKT